MMLSPSLYTVRTLDRKKNSKYSSWLYICIKLVSVENSKGFQNMKISNFPAAFCPLVHCEWDATQQLETNNRRRNQFATAPEVTRTNLCYIFVFVSPSENVKIVTNMNSFNYSQFYWEQNVLNMRQCQIFFLRILFYVEIRYAELRIFFFV
jgi:hypothetical protein